MDVIKSKLDSKAVKLAGPRLEGFVDIINLLLEYCVFFKWMYFKNRPRGNLLLVRSVLVATVYIGGFFLFSSFLEFTVEGIDVHPVHAFVIGVILIYWNMTSVFHNKSTFCANLYNDVVKAYGAEDLRQAEMLENTLALHLLAMDLWAHRTFTNSFSRSLQKAADHVFEGETKLEFFGDFTEGKLTDRDARRVLQAYQAHLFLQAQADRG